MLTLGPRWDVNESEKIPVYWPTPVPSGPGQRPDTGTELKPEWPELEPPKKVPECRWVMIAHETFTCAHLLPPSPSEEEE
ncbi:hypothetical protein ZHAS_00003426 [Anopheles sinensis]|uniref:Uncharacterized protein n=1 Tax=Anopheles sinensis TaxID=74873 RepID=A0A084VEB1_ANOSI|nr:hypothetical protein ZHAS_00003426 [Anopheles sinensis]